MANTQGSFENPFCIDVIEPSRPPRANNGKAKAYYEVQNDRPRTDLPVDAIPSESRAWGEGKSRRDSNNVTSDHAGVQTSRQTEHHGLRLAYVLANNTAQSRKTSVVPPARLAEPRRDPVPLPCRSD
jgi:hypothetical protein